MDGYIWFSTCLCRDTHIIRHRNRAKLRFVLGSLSPSSLSLWVIGLLLRSFSWKRQPFLSKTLWHQLHKVLLLRIIKITCFKKCDFSLRIVWSFTYSWNFFNIFIRLQVRGLFGGSLFWGTLRFIWGSKSCPEIWLC